jgi:DNA-binding Xre family transcriptional regulator
VSIRWKLREYIEEHNLSALSVEVKAGIGRNSIYRLTRADGPRLIDRQTLAKVICALRELTGSSVEVSDLLEYDDDSNT